MLEGEYTRFKRRFSDTELDETIVLGIEEYEVEMALEALAAEEKAKAMAKDFKSKIMPLLETRYSRKKAYRGGDGKKDFFLEQLGMETKEDANDVEEYLHKNDLLKYYSIYLKLRGVSFSQETLRKIIKDNETPYENISRVKAAFFVTKESNMEFKNLNLEEQMIVSNILASEEFWELDYILFGYRLKED